MHIFLFFLMHHFQLDILYYFYNIKFIILWKVTFLFYFLFYFYCFYWIFLSSLPLYFSYLSSLLLLLKPIIFINYVFIVTTFQIIRVIMKYIFKLNNKRFILNTDKEELLLNEFIFSKCISVTPNNYQTTKKD